MLRNTEIYSMILYILAGDYYHSVCITRRIASSGYYFGGFVYVLSIFLLSEDGHIDVERATAKIILIIIIIMVVRMQYAAHQENSNKFYMCIP